jgi:hypothetical protein
VISSIRGEQRYLIYILALEAACVAIRITKEWIDEKNRDLKLIRDEAHRIHSSVPPRGAEYEKAMLIEEIERVLSIKRITSVNRLEEIKRIYMTKAPRVA